MPACRTGRDRGSSAREEVRSAATRGAHDHVVQGSLPPGDRAEVLFGGDDLPAASSRPAVMAAKVTDASAGGWCPWPVASGVCRCPTISSVPPGATHPAMRS